MRLEELGTHWDQFGQTDPLYAILTCEGKEGNKWSREEFFARGRAEIDGLMRYIQSLKAVLKPEKALDFGCGVGRLTQALAALFDHVSGVDIAPSMIRLANEYNQFSDRCRYILNQKDDLSIFPDKSFNFIYSNITLQHMAPRYSKNYIKEFVRVLAPHGLLVFQLPQAPVGANRTTLRKVGKSLVPISLLNRYRRLRYGRINPVMRMYGIDKSKVVGLLEQQNVDIIHIKEEPMAEVHWVSYLYFVKRHNGSDESQ